MTTKKNMPSRDVSLSPNGTLHGWSSPHENPPRSCSDVRRQCLGHILLVKSTRKNLSCATYRSYRIEFISVYNIVYKVNQQLLHVPLTIDSSIKTIAPYPSQLQACVHPKRNSCRKANIVTYRGETNRIHWIPSWDPADNLANAEKTNCQIFCSWCAKVKLSYGWMTGLRTSNLQKAPFFLWCDCP